MRRRIHLGGLRVDRLSLVAVAAVCAGGCASPAPVSTAAPTPPPSDAVHASPTLAELPDLATPYQRSIAAKVGVHTVDRQPRVRIVPDGAEPPLTPEEEAALAAKSPPQADDLLGFYRPERGTEHGVMPLESVASSQSYGRGGAFVGLAPELRKTGTWGVAGYNAGVHFATRVSATSYIQETRKVGVGPESRVQSGEGVERRAAARQDRAD